MIRKRKKKLIAGLMSLTMIATLMPTAAFASTVSEQANIKVVKAVSTNESTADVQSRAGIMLMSVGDGQANGEMDGAGFLAQASDSKITLTDDVTITSGNVVVNEDLTIDLGNHNLTFKNGLLATGKDKGATLTIEGSGKIKAEAGSNNIVILAQAGSTINLNGCSVEAQNAQKAIQVQSATVNINGSTITGAENQQTVTVMGEKAKVTLKKGTIKSNGDSSIGVVVQGDGTTADANFTMEGGKIESEGTAISINNSTGSGVDFECFTMKGGEITQSADAQHPAVVIANAAAYISAGTITGTADGTAAVQIGANSESGKLTMTGGEVKSTGETSFGIYALKKGDDPTTVNISGDAKISGQETGVEAGEDSNVTILSGTVTGRFAAGANSGGTLNIKGGTIKGTAAGIGTNGKDANNGTTINVSDGNVTGGIVGAYMPAGTLNVEGNANISGQAGIVVRNGNLNVTGGTITGTGEGQISIGDATDGMDHVKIPTGAVVFDKVDSYAENGNAELSAGEFSGNIVYTEKGTPSTEANDKLTVSGGTYENAGDNFSSYLEDNKLAIGVHDTTYVGEQANNAMESLEKGDTLTVLQTSEGEDLTVPTGVEVKNETGGEITINGESVNNDIYVADTSALEKAIGEAEKITDEDKYTVDSWNAFQSALNKARDILKTPQSDKSYQEQIDNAVKALESAKNGLANFVGNTVGLQGTIVKAKALNGDNYTVDSWNNLQKALKEAQNVLDNPRQSRAYQDDIDNAAEALNDAINALDNFTANTSTLNDTVNAAKALNAESYTADSWNALQKVLETAQGLLDNPQNTRTYQARVDNAVSNLNSAIEKLVAATQDNPQQGNPSDTPTNTPQGDTTDQQANPQDTVDYVTDAPQTGDNMNILVWVIAATIALLGMCVVIFSARAKANR